MRATTIRILLGALLCSCGSSQQVPAEQAGTQTSASERAGATQVAGAEPHEGASDSEEEDLRALGADATYEDLLRAARRLDDRRDQDSTAGCLLQRGWRLTADLSVAVRPLRNAPADLDERLARERGPGVVLSRWGAYGAAEGEGAPGIVFTVITSTLPPPVEPALVWVITDQGIYVLSTTEEREPRAGTLDEAVAATSGEPGALFVSAEAGVPLERLAEVLARAPSAMAGRIGLVVPLAEGTRVPAPTDAAQADDVPICTEGLPPLPEDAPRVWMMGGVRESLGPLQHGLRLCLGAWQSGVGGRIRLALRITPEGRVGDACIAEDATHDPALRACLLRAARAVVFDFPEPPPGFVDVEVPLVFGALPSQRQRPLCE